MRRREPERLTKVLFPLQPFMSHLQWKEGRMLPTQFRDLICDDAVGSKATETELVCTAVETKMELRRTCDQRQARGTNNESIFGREADGHFAVLLRASEHTCESSCPSTRSPALTIRGHSIRRVCPLFVTPGHCLNSPSADQVTCPTQALLLAAP